MEQGEKRRSSGSACVPNLPSNRNETTTTTTDGGQVYNMMRMIKPLVDRRRHRLPARPFVVRSVAVAVAERERKEDESEQLAVD